MEKLKFNSDNAKYYSEDFIKGFECGVERQFEKDKAEETHIVRGKWIYDKEHSIENKIFICSNCNVAVEFQGIRRYNFCPKCGAKMEESEEE